MKNYQEDMIEEVNKEYEAFQKSMETCNANIILPFQPLQIKDMEKLESFLPGCKVETRINDETKAIEIWVTPPKAIESIEINFDVPVRIKGKEEVVLESESSVAIMGENVHINPEIERPKGVKNLFSNILHFLRSFKPTIQVEGPPSNNQLDKESDSSHACGCQNQ